MVACLFGPVVSLPLFHLFIYLFIYLLFVCLLGSFIPKKDRGDATDLWGDQIIDDYDISFEVLYDKVRPLALFIFSSPFTLILLLLPLLLLLLLLTFFFFFLILTTDIRRVQKLLADHISGRGKEDQAKVESPYLSLSLSPLSSPTPPTPPTPLTPLPPLPSPLLTSRLVERSRVMTSCQMSTRSSSRARSTSGGNIN